MLEELPYWPGLEESALLGDLFLLVGDRQRAGQVYLEAWRRGEVSGLLGFLALEADEVSVDVLIKCGQELVELSQQGQLVESRAEEVARLLVAVLGLLRGEPGQAGSVAVESLSAAPGVSVPLALRGAQPGHASWSQAVGSVWERLQQVESAEERGHLIFKLHHLSLAMPDEIPFEHADAVMDLAAQGATGALLYLVLRRLDMFSAGPPPQLGVEPPGHWLPLAEHERARLETFLKFLAGHLQDRREKVVFQTRYADWLWSTGQADAAGEVYAQQLDGGPVPVSDLVRERLQRLHVVEGEWAKAAAISLERAERCDDIALRMALLLLSLSYLYQAQASPDGYARVAERVLNLEGHGRQMPPAPFRYAFEVIEGTLLQTGRVEELEALWRRSGALPSAARTRSVRVPDRSIESMVLQWRRQADSGDGPLELRPQWLERRLTRRLLLVRTLRDGHRERALLVLTRAGTLSDSEELLKSALMLEMAAAFEDNVDGGRLRDQVLQTLRSRLDNVDEPTPRDLVPLYLLRAELGRQGKLDGLVEVFEAFIAKASGSLRGLAELTLGQELFEAGRFEDASGVARQAFASSPGDARVRALMTTLAERTGDEVLLAQLADFVDDDALERLLSRDPISAATFEQAQRQAAEEGQEGALAASDTLVQLANQVDVEAARAALLRRASELSQRGGELDRASALALEALEMRPDDRLALGQVMSVALEAQQYEDVAELIAEQDGRLGLANEGLLDALLAGAEVLFFEQDAAESAEVLGLSALSELIESDKNGESLRRALVLLERMHVAQDRLLEWRDLLERSLQSNEGAASQPELHASLGNLYEHHMPDRELAIEHYRSALLGDTSRSGALEALERLFSQAERYSDLAGILRVQADAAAEEGTEQAQRRQEACLVALARLQAEKLEDAAEARQNLNTVLALNPRNLEALLAAARLDRQAQQWEQAVGLLENAARLVEAQRQRSDLYFEIGQIYEHLGQLNPTVENYMVSFICDNRNIQAFKRLEQLYERFARWAELVSIYDVAIDAARQEPESGYDAERLFARKGQVEYQHLERERASALSLLEALRLNPTEERYATLLEHILGQDKAPELLAESMRIRIDGLPERADLRRSLLYRLANLYERHGERLSEAIELYQAVLAQWPGELLAAERLESLCKQLERWDELVAFYQQRLDSADSPEAVIPLYWAIAQVAERKLRNLELAISTYRGLLDVVPGNLDVLRALGRLFEGTKRWDELIEISEREVKLTEKPDKKAHVYFKMGSIYETFRHELDKAIECYESAVELDPRCVPALHGLREIYRRQQDWPNVVQTLEREAILWEEPRERASIHTMIADVYREHLQDTERSERHVRDALELVPDFQGAQRRLLDLHIAQEHWQEASELVTELSQKSEGRPSRQRAALFFKHAHIARRLGRVMEAIGALRIALDIDPEYPDAFEVYLELTESADSPLEHDDIDRPAFLAGLEKQFEERQLDARLVRLTIHRARLTELDTEPVRALAFYRQAVERAPLELEPHQAWAAALVRLRRFEEAAVVWESLLEKLGHTEESKATRQSVWRALGQLHTDWRRSPEEGLVCYRQALALAPKDTNALYGASQAAFMLEQWGQARLWMEPLLEDEAQTRAEHAFYMGRILEIGFGDDEGALRAYSQARSLDITDTRAVNAAVHILVRQGKWMRMEKLLEGTIDALSDRHPVQARGLRLLLADALAAVGDELRARGAYEAIMHDPDASDWEVRTAFEASGALRKARIPDQGVMTLAALVEEDPVSEADDDPDAHAFLLESTGDESLDLEPLELGSMDMESVDEASLAALSQPPAVEMPTEVPWEGAELDVSAEVNNGEAVLAEVVESLDVADFIEDGEAFEVQALQDTGTPVFVSAEPDFRQPEPVENDVTPEPALDEGQGADEEAAQPLPEAQPSDPDSEQVLEALRGRLSQGALGRWMVLSALEALGKATDVERASLQDLQSRRRELTQPLIKPGSRGFWGHFLSPSPELAALAALEPALEAVFPPVEVVDVAGLVTDGPLRLLRQRVASWLGVEPARARRLLLEKIGPTGVGLRTGRYEDAGALVLSYDTAEAAGAHQRSALFALGRGLALVKLGLVAAWGMSTDELAGVLEMAAVLQASASLEALLDVEGPLEPMAEMLLGELEDDHLRALLEAAELYGPVPVPLNPAQAQARVELALDEANALADRAGVMASGHVASSIDVLVASAGGQSVARLNSKERWEALSKVERLRQMLLMALSEPDASEIPGG